MRFVEKPAPSPWRRDGEVGDVLGNAGDVRDATPTSAPKLATHAPGRSFEGQAMARSKRRAGGGGGGGGGGIDANMSIEIDSSIA